MLNLVIFGAPGSGKGTQSDLLSEKYGLFHISTGDVLREKIKNQTELGKKAEEIISKGQLIPDELMIDILLKVMSDQPEAKGFIFDGFPRTLPQAEALSEMLQKNDNDIAAVIALTVDENELVNRLLKRGEVSGRTDDNLETIQKRLTVYRNQTEPLIGFYKQVGIFHGIDGIGTIDHISGQISAIIEAL
ncbi:MAG: adenylate kinase [Bacteroidales bacterium]|nr:adenylate kinase [Bacteroidales bacterium]